MRRSPWLKLHLGSVYLFLYAPILVLIGMSFNASGLPTAWTGFTTDWYVSLFRNETILTGARNTLIVAVGATLIATAIGTLLALGLERYVRSPALDAAVIAPAIMPDIVLAIGLLSFYTLISFTLGLNSILFAHVLFNIAFVAAVVRARLHNFDRSIEEASQDLGAGPFETFLRVTFPVILPGIIAAALLAFTLSVDEFVLAFFTAGPADPTLPIVIYAMVRFGVTPEINALAAILMLFSFTLILSTQRLSGIERAL